MATSIRLANMSVDESGIGGREPTRRGKVLGILRDALRQKSMGIIEEIPEKGIVKYAKPAGVIVSLIPVTSPYITPIGIAIYAIKCKDAVIFSPHPSSRKTTFETVRLMRARSRELGVPADVLQCIERPSIPLAKALMAAGDLTIATGGPAMVKAAYSSGKPAYGVGAGNATMVIDETADIAEAALNTRISKTNDNGSGCSADGNLVVDSSIYDALPRRSCSRRAAISSTAARRSSCGRPIGMPRAAAPPTPSRARPRSSPPRPASRSRPARRSSSSQETRDRQAAPVLHRKAGRRAGASSSTRASTHALDLVRQIFETGGRGHSCGIYSFNDDHIHRLALMAPVSRIMVRQVQSRSNAGNFTNGMPHDLEHGLRHLGRQHHQREHLAQALHERHLGEPADSRRQALRSGAVRRVLQQSDSRLTPRDPMSTSPLPARPRAVPAAGTRIASYLMTEYLERLGVEVIFGLCGHTVIAFLDALSKSRIRFVSTRHEQVAAHAADGYARATGKPGVVLSHPDPRQSNRHL